MVVATTAVTLAGCGLSINKGHLTEVFSLLVEGKDGLSPIGQCPRSLHPAFFHHVHVLSGVFFHEDDFIPLVLPFFEHLRDGLQF